MSNGEKTLVTATQQPPDPDTVVDISDIVTRNGTSTDDYVQLTEKKAEMMMQAHLGMILHSMETYWKQTVAYSETGGNVAEYKVPGATVETYPYTEGYVGGHIILHGDEKKTAVHYMNALKLLRDIANSEGFRLDYAKLRDVMTSLWPSRQDEKQAPPRIPSAYLQYMVRQSEGEIQLSVSVQFELSHLNPDEKNRYLTQRESIMSIRKGYGLEMQSNGAEGFILTSTQKKQEGTVKQQVHYKPGNA